MLTKGIIIAIKSNNMYSVRLPIFEGAGNKNEFIVDAGCVIPPGIYNGFAVDDVVEVGFEENNAENAMILGKLYRGQELENEVKIGAVNAGNLTINDKAHLPKDTTFNDIPLDNILAEIGTLKINYNTIIANFENEIKQLRAEIADLKK